ncbi:hypothetical protein [Agromyces sp. SYSU T0242]|uniref:hypothetical protein n=1 Tax=Agromyces litoreus TaxID=3158561 RepID=UPI0033957E73
MDLAHGFLAQQITTHDQRLAESVAERRVRARARAAERTAGPAPTRRPSVGLGLRERLHLGYLRGAH